MTTTTKLITFKNEGPMGNKHSHLRVFRNHKNARLDFTIISFPDTDEPKHSTNVVLDEQQEAQLLNILQRTNVKVPNVNITIRGYGDDDE